jgi:phytoene/squalene synthetase
MSVASAFEYCATRVRQLDYENYLCALFLPREHRPAALALRAFNAETASALGATKEPQLALMRLKWWRDAVDAAHDADETSRTTPWRSHSGLCSRRRMPAVALEPKRGSNESPTRACGTPRWD